MSMFLIKHPFIALVMVGMVCTAVIETAEVIVNGKTRIKLFKQEETEQKEEKKDEDKSLEE